MKFPVWAGLALALAGCASQPVGPSAQAGVLTPAARAQALGLAEGVGAAADCAAPRWGLSGRVALSNGREGGSGRLLWSQGAGRLHLELSAPVTRQSWVLDVSADGARLQGVGDAPLRGADPAELIRAASGWEVPVRALGCWLRGAAAGEAAFGPATIAVDGAGLPRRIEQAGWTVEYSAWTPAANDELPMPTRISATRGVDRVRLVVDRWTAE